MIIIIDGPPASGKSTIVVFLARRFSFKVYGFKRLGFLNLFAELLLRVILSVSVLSVMKVSEDLKTMQVLKRERRDPILLISSGLLKRIAFIDFLLEAIYKFVRFFLFIILALMCRNVVIDEWFSLGWANYYNLMIRKKAFMPRHVEMLMRLDIMFLRFLSRVSRIRVYFIDRSREKLTLFWRRRGHVTPYDARFAILVRYFFNLFVQVCKEHKINVDIKYLYLK
ncbi:hypothetical protein [Thermosphaera aggregans]|uniref:Uncharacterized protein n=1 Tax=Thermosphaera aggregans (strain DSM 11486 / M11TL) TaxID=633148 RepID=D5U145_THEAM|nr:hypothetical protein [Thermosphaera aggregans]ADG90845.1 hypothetical protein Tagg_0571 [Thermosphaera aggregans DSM 11486]